MYTWYSQRIDIKVHVKGSARRALLLLLLLLLLSSFLLTSEAALVLETVYDIRKEVSDHENV